MGKRYKYHVEKPVYSQDTDRADEEVTLGFGALPEGVIAGTPVSAQVTLEDVPPVILVPPPNQRPNPPAGATAVSFAEESPDTVATYRLSAPAPGAVLSLDKEGPDAASFRIRGDTLYFKEMENFPDFEAPADVAGEAAGVVAGDNAYVVGLYAWDGSLSSDTVSVTVSVRNVDEPGVVSVSPSSAQVGTRLQATLTDPDGGVSDTLWQWQHRARGVTGWTGIEDSTLSGFLPGDTEVGQSLRATVTYIDGESSGPTDRKPAASAALGPVLARPVRTVSYSASSYVAREDGDTATVTNEDEPGTATVSPSTPEAGQTLRAELSDPDGDVRVNPEGWQWERREGSASWAAINDSTAARYTPGAADVGQMLRVTVGYADGHGAGKQAVSGYDLQGQSKPLAGGAWPEARTTRYKADSRVGVILGIGEIDSTTSPRGRPAATMSTR